MRKIAIGDIHGCNVAFGLLLEAIDPQPEDTIITLGDYIDRGEDSKGVIDRLIALKDKCTLIPLLGNHELMLMRAFGGKDDLAGWIRVGGYQTLTSYGWGANSASTDELKDIIPYEHMAFISECVGYHEDDENVFVHANYEWDVPMGQQTENASFWAHLRDGPIQKPHISGKKFWVGHTPQKSGEVLDMGHIVCIDTGGFRTGWITAVDVTTGRIWQANENGKRRNRSLHEPKWED